MSYSTDFIRSTYADLEIARENKFMIIGMSIGTEIYQSHAWTGFHKIYVIEWNSSEKVYKPGERDWRKFRRHHVQIIYGLTHWQEFGKANMHAGSGCSKITSVWRKFICIDIAGERQNSEKYHCNVVHTFVPMKRSERKFFTLFSCFWGES